MRWCPGCTMLRLFVALFVCTVAAWYYDVFATEKSVRPTKISLANLKSHLTPRSRDASDESTRQTFQKVDKVVLSLVACNDRFDESVVVIKSVLIFTETPVYFIIFADDKNLPKFNVLLTEWRALLKDSFNFELKGITFPEKHREEWMNLFGKCAAQRLFIPSLVMHIDSMIYVDTDILFLGPVDELWKHFCLFNSTQMSALAPEDENPNISWYPRFAKHPFYGKVGLNSGVMLMNLTRMRSFDWIEYLTPIMQQYRHDIPWGDQDIINIIMHHHPEAVYELSCRYNYRPDQCMYGDGCSAATQHGIFVLHGSRRVFHTHLRYKQPAFRAVYLAIESHQLGTDPRLTLLPTLHRNLEEAPASTCGELRDAFLKTPTAAVETLSRRPDS